jgi:hypothetical protein
VRFVSHLPIFKVFIWIAGVDIPPYDYKEIAPGKQSCLVTGKDSLTFETAGDHQPDAAKPTTGWNSESGKLRKIKGRKRNRGAMSSATAAVAVGVDGGEAGVLSLLEDIVPWLAIFLRMSADDGLPCCGRC